jgi:hypothetical protein
MLTKFITKIFLLLCLSLLSLGLIPAQLAANTLAQANSSEVETTESQQVQNEKRKVVIAEAASALEETNGAIKALEKQDTKTALAALERAIGKLDIVLAREPELALAPVDIETHVIDVVTGMDTVKLIREQSEKAIKQGHLQKARRLLENLASESVLSVSNLPLATYPEAIKKAVRQIDDNKFDEAKFTLKTALNTVVVNKTVLPLPVMSAANLLQEAETLAEKNERSDKENQRLVKVVDLARSELEFAEALGYGTNKDFSDMYKQLDMINEKTAEGKSGIGFFTKLKKQLSDSMENSDQAS